MNMEKRNDFSLSLKEIAEELEAQVYSHPDKLNVKCKRVAAGDLMSDLLHIQQDGVILLTGLNSVQTARTCLLTDMKALILVRGKKPSEELLKEAELHGIPVLSTKLSLFSSCGRLYVRGLRGLP